MTAAALRELASEEVRRRTFWRGETKEAARSLGLSPSYINAFANGTVRMTDKAAARILAAAREEELRLADKIERELNAHWYKERREARKREQQQGYPQSDAPAWPKSTAEISTLQADSNLVDNIAIALGDPRAAGA